MHLRSALIFLFTVVSLQAQVPAMLRDGDTIRCNGPILGFDVFETGTLLLKKHRYIIDIHNQGLKKLRAHEQRFYDDLRSPGSGIYRYRSCFPRWDDQHLYLLSRRPLSKARLRPLLRYLKLIPARYIRDMEIPLELADSGDVRLRYITHILERARADTLCGLEGLQLSIGINGRIDRVDGLPQGTLPDEVVYRLMSIRNFPVLKVNGLIEPYEVFVPFSRQAAKNKIFLREYYQSGPLIRPIFDPSDSVFIYNDTLEKRSYLHYFRQGAVVCMEDICANSPYFGLQPDFIFRDVDGDGDQDAYTVEPRLHTRQYTFVLNGQTSRPLVTEYGDTLLPGGFLITYYNTETTGAIRLTRVDRGLPLCEGYYREEKGSSWYSIRYYSPFTGKEYTGKDKHRGRKFYKLMEERMKYLLAHPDRLLNYRSNAQ